MEIDESEVKRMRLDDEETGGWKDEKFRVIVMETDETEVMRSRLDDKEG
jgi:hypothetical protein